MEICVINPFFFPYAGGTEKVLMQVYKRLSKKHNITVISYALGAGQKEAEELVEGIKVVRLKTKYMDVPGLPLPFMVAEGFRERIQRESADIYHINNRYLVFPLALGAIKNKGKKLALTLHNALPKNIGPVTDFCGLVYDAAWGRKIMKAADLITGITQNVVDTTVPAAYRNKTHVVYNGVDFKSFRPRSRSDRNVKIARERLGDGITIMNNARLVPQKGQKYLMRAFAELVKEGIASNLLIIGKGPLESSLRGIAGRLHIPDRLSIISGIPEGQLPYYYNAGDIFALPSLYEPASIALLEALSSGVPTVAAKTGGIPEMMKDNGLYVNPKSEKDIKEKISMLLGDKEMAEKFAKNGRALMMKEHNWDDIAKEYERLFLETIRY